MIRKPKAYREVITKANIVILGGGPAGLAAAIAVSQLGYRADIVDHAVPPIDKTCGEGLMPETVDVLERLGISVPLDAGQRFRGIRFLNAHSSVAADFPNGFGIGMRRTTLHSLLLRRAEQLGVNCHWGVKQIQTGKMLPHDFLIAADGQNSCTRKSQGLDQTLSEKRRFAFRRHYRIAPWSSYVDVHWGPKCQIYITPINADEVCLVCMSENPQLRVDRGLEYFPELRKRISNAPPASRETGALSVSRKLRRVWRNNVALIGDASGSVDAITGEGLGLSFKQALSLANALRAGNLNHYQQEHANLSRRPRIMGKLMLTLDLNLNLQQKSLAALAAYPKIFASLLGVHVGAQPVSSLFSWQLFQLCRGFLRA